MPRALVTGASGFVGRYLIDELANSRDLLCLTSGVAPQGDDCEWVSANIKDSESVSGLVSDWKPDQIFHLAAISSPTGFSVRDYYETNVLGTLNVLEAAAKVGADVLVVGSAYAYGSYQSKIREDFQLNPVNPYGASKAAQDSLAGSFGEGDSKVITVRPFNHTGPGQLESYLVPGLITKLQNRKSQENSSQPIDIGNATAVRDFLDVRDVVGAYRLLMDESKKSGVFNVCSGVGYSVLELLTICCEKVGAEILYKEQQNLLRKRDIEYLVGDCSKLKQEISWSPRYKLSETIETMIETRENNMSVPRS